MNYQQNKHIKNFDCLRTVTLWAGVLGIIQSLLWIGLTLTGIFAYTCYIDLPKIISYGSLVQYVFYELYFKGTCEPTNYQQIGIQTLGDNPTILDPEDILIWTCVYLGVAVCWLLSSVLLLTHTKKNCIPTTLGVLFTWVILTFFICAMDLALGIIFALDYGYLSENAYDLNFSTGQAGPVLAENAVWVGAAVAAISLMIISFKGFVLWIINFILHAILLVKAFGIVSDKDRNDTLFIMPRKDSDDILTTRPPIDAYENNNKPIVFTNEAFVPDNRSTGTIELNQEAIARAARMSTDASLQDRRFRNLDNFQQYPPPRSNNNRPAESVKPQEIVITATAGFPVPDYTPPMTRANQSTQNSNGLLRNQRYQ